MKTSTSIYLLLILSFLLLSCNQQRGNRSSIENTKKENTEIITNIRTTSVYDSLKNTSNPNFQKWLKQQDSLTEYYFLNSPTYHLYLESLEKLENISVEQNQFIRISESKAYFYVRYDSIAGGDKIYHQKTLDSKPEIIFDCVPKNLSRIDYLSISFDSNTLAIGFNNDNGFSSDIIFYDISKKQFMNDKISNISPDYGGIEWLPDSSGFIYLYFPVIDKSKAGFKKNSFSTLHVFGKENTPKPIFGKSKALKIKSDFYPKVKISSSKDEYVIGYVASSNDFYDAYITSINGIIHGKPDWKPFYSLKDSIYYNQGLIRRNDYYFRQNKKGKTELASIVISNPNFKQPNIIHKIKGHEQIVDFELTKENLYFSTSKYGSQIRLFNIDQHQNKTEIKLPFVPGYLNFFGASTTNDFIGIGIDGWTSDYKRYLVNLNKTLKLEGIRQNEDYDKYEDLKTKQVIVKSHDLEEVPLTLVFNNELALNSDKKVLIYVYGAYGENIAPYFDTMLLEWVIQGNILAFAHVRGGGEKGKDWHLDGMKLNKPNSWKDLIACSEYLISNNITTKGFISLYTSSAGGITAAMAVNERPDLFSSMIADVPRLNPYDLELDGSLSSTSYLEYGSVNDSIEKTGLIAMDPFLNISSKKNYPATFISSSYKDDRIPIWDNSKYISKLRDSTLTNEKPILLDIDFESSHSSSNSPYSIYYARIFTFAELNMKR